MVFISDSFRNISLGDAVDILCRHIERTDNRIQCFIHPFNDDAVITLKLISIRPGIQFPGHSGIYQFTNALCDPHLLADVQHIFQTSDDFVVFIFEGRSCITNGHNTGGQLGLCISSDISILLHGPGDCTVFCIAVPCIKQAETLLSKAAFLRFSNRISPGIIHVGDIKFPVDCHHRCRHSIQDTYFCFQFFDYSFIHPILLLNFIFFFFMKNTFSFCFSRSKIIP